MSLRQTASKLKDLLLKNRGTRQTIAKNVFWLSVGQIASRLIRAAVIIYAARILGAAEYGVFSYVLGLAGFFTIFTDIGVSNILTREAAKNPDTRTHYLATTFWIKVTLLLMTAAVMVSVAPHFSNIEAAKQLIPFIALLTIFDGIRDFSISFLRALNRMEIEAFINLLTNITITVAGFAILAVSATAKALTLSYIASSGVGMLAVVLILRHDYAQVIEKFQKHLVRPILKAGAPIAVIALLGSFMLNIDMVMLGWWRSAEEIGYYSAAQKVIQILYLLPTILAAASFPTIARFVHEQLQERIKFIIERAMTAAFALSLPITAGGLILAKKAMVFLYGSAYAPAAAAFVFLIVTVPLVYAGTLLGNLSVAYDKQRRLAIPVAAGSIGNVVFNALLIPTFGIAGCSAATIVALLLNNGLMWRIVKKEMINFKTLLYLKKIVIATLIMGVCAWALNALGVAVLINIFVLAIIYGGTLIFFREPLLSEFKAIIETMRD